MRPEESLIKHDLTGEGVMMKMYVWLSVGKLYFKYSFSRLTTFNVR